MMNIKFKNGKPKLASLGKRSVPRNGEVVYHPDGTPLYMTNAVSHESAVDTLVILSHFNKNPDDIRHLMYLYSEHILDLEDPDEKTFYMLMDDFGQWWRHIEEKLGTDEK